MKTGEWIMVGMMVASAIFFLHWMWTEEQDKKRRAEWREQCAREWAEQHPNRQWHGHHD